MSFMDLEKGNYLSSEWSDEEEDSFIGDVVPFDKSRILSNMKVQSQYLGNTELNKMQDEKTLKQMILELRKSKTDRPSLFVEPEPFGLEHTWKVFLQIVAAVFHIHQNKKVFAQLSIDTIFMNEYCYPHQIQVYGLYGKPALLVKSKLLESLDRKTCQSYHTRDMNALGRILFQMCSLQIDQDMNNTTFLYQMDQKLKLAIEYCMMKNATIEHFLYFMIDRDRLENCLGDVFATDVDLYYASKHNERDCDPFRLENRLAKLRAQFNDHYHQDSIDPRETESLQDDIKGLSRSILSDFSTLICYGNYVEKQLKKEVMSDKIISFRIATYEQMDHAIIQSYLKEFMITDKHKEEKGPSFSSKSTISSLSKDIKTNQYGVVLYMGVRDQYHSQEFLDSIVRKLMIYYENLISNVTNLDATETSKPTLPSFHACSFVRPCPSSSIVNRVK